MMPDLELWQWLAGIGGALVALERAATAAERLGLVPGRVLHWWQHRLLARIEEEARDRALTALLTNGISSRLDEVKEQGEKTHTELIRHMTETAPLIELFVEEHRQRGTTE